MGDFSEYLEQEKILHYHTYPWCPKMNAHSERFNRTIREGVLNINRYRLTDLAYANRIVRSFLSFYNTKRVHCAFENKLTPLQKLCLYYIIDTEAITAI
jgi:transposase InsO family protein